MDMRAEPPETFEGWYALHQILRLNHAMLRASSGAERARTLQTAQAAFDELMAPRDDGWSLLVDLVGSRADVMLMHLRPTLDALGAAQYRLARSPLYDALEPVYTFLSVTEAGMYQLTAQLAKRVAARGGRMGDDIYQAELAERAKVELESPHLRKRLYPVLPEQMPYVCFYPMDKRRAAEQNWYTQDLDERSRMMQEHGKTGRNYAGKVLQIVTGAIGLDAWEWGVTLFAADPLAFKKLVTDMRFDEVSAKYAEFGDFYVGKRVEPRVWLERLPGPATVPTG